MLGCHRQFLSRLCLQVENLEEFEFRPGHIVHTICGIYAQFRGCDVFLAACWLPSNRVTTARTASH